MASQSEPTTTTDVLNYVGQLFYIGAKFGKSPLLSRAGLQSYKTATGSQFPIGNVIEGDSPAQDGQTEDASITSMTDTSFTATQATQYMQQFRYTYIVSYAAQALSGAISGVAIAGEPIQPIASMPVQRLAHMKQAMCDFEYSALRGASQAWTNASTAGKMQGLVTAVEAGSETDASSEALSKTLIETEVERMADAGAEFGNMVIAGGAHQIMMLNSIYGNSIQSRTEGGTSVQSLLLPIAGNCEIVYNPILADDDLLFVDMTHFSPVFGLVPGQPPIIVEPLAKTAAGDREQIFMLASVDYEDTDFHGMISGLASS